MDEQHTATHCNTLQHECEDEDTPRLCTAQVNPKSTSNQSSKPCTVLQSVRMTTVDECESEQCAHSPSFVLILALIDSAGGSSFSLICPHSFDPPAESMRERMRTNEGE